jgi:TatA/E family protein of Tat protein translocase
MGIENPIHLLFVAVVALLVLGPKRLPELARALGNGIREFRESVNLQGEHPLVQQLAQPLAQEGVQDSVALEALAGPEPVALESVAPEPVALESVALESVAPEPVALESVDPTQTVRSGDAPDRRPL